MEETRFTDEAWRLSDDGLPVVYALNDNGTNRMYLSVDAGNTGGSGNLQRTTREELLANALLISQARDLYYTLYDIAHIESLTLEKIRWIAKEAIEAAHPSQGEKGN